jgi:predicted DsbA family dithiol-disulfide isomerase
VVEQVKNEFGAEIEWLPFLLRPNMPEAGEDIPAYIKAKKSQTGDRLRQLAEMQNLPMVTSTWLSNTRLAHEATEYARERGKGTEFHRVVFRLYYGEDKDIGRWDILRLAATITGLDPDDMQKSVSDGQYRAIVDDQLADAQSLGISSVPTYVLNDRYAIVGAQPMAVFKQVIERLQTDANNSETDLA